MRTEMSFMLSNNDRAERTFHAIKHVILDSERSPMKCGSCGDKMTNNVFVCSICWESFSNALFGSAEALTLAWQSHVKPLIKTSKNLDDLKRKLMLNKLDE